MILDPRRKARAEVWKTGVEEAEEGVKSSGGYFHICQWRTRRLLLPGMEEEEVVVVGWMSCGANCHLKSFAVDLSWCSLVDASVLLFFFSRLRR